MSLSPLRRARRVSDHFQTRASASAVAPTEPLPNLSPHHDIRPLSISSGSDPPGNAWPTTLKLSTHMRGSGNAHQAVLDGSWQPVACAKRERDRPSRNLHQIRCLGFFSPRCQCFTSFHWPVMGVSALISSELVEKAQ